MQKMIKFKKERTILKTKFIDFRWFFALLAVFGVSGECVAAQMQNPRAATVQTVSSPRNGTKTLDRGDGDSSAVVSRSAIRSTGRAAKNVNTVSRSATTRQNVISPARAATVSARSATDTSKSGRSAKTSVTSGISRAAISRATAVFNDLSKIGGGYLNCRDAYATCMDQFCAKANDTYRRCYCSQKFLEFRDTEDALTAANTLLQQFEDKNLSAVDKTAAEVNAMYSATVGELAVKNDVSGAQAVLNEISDLLSGKKKSSSTSKSWSELMNGDSASTTSIDDMLADIWSGDSGSSIFDTDTGTELTALEGQALFNAAHKQCLEIIGGSCESAAVLNMSTSAYNIMITQDCNAYERAVDVKRETVENSVRQMEKALRSARLEEYRAHNSADISECLERVKTAMTADVVCGANYNHCMDFSGKYINQTTGEVRYTPDLFKLKDVIKLDGTDVLVNNRDFNKELDARRQYAESALQTCRDLSDTVWTEFKRQAIIEIAQAQADKIEEVKMSCVNTMKLCYDETGAQLESFDTESAGLVGALAASASREMCLDKVSACISLFAKDPTKCKVDTNGKINNQCEYAALMTLIETVDEERVNDGCKTGLENYAKELCTPVSGDKGYPWNCVKMSLSEIEKDLKTKSEAYCASDVSGANVTDAVSEIASNISESVSVELQKACKKYNGVWTDVSSATDFVVGFYHDIYGGDTTFNDWGACVENSTRVACLGYNAGNEQIATFDEKTQTCSFVSSWYEERCGMLGGHWENSICYVGKE